MQIGLVPKRVCLPCQGGTIGEALHITIPIKPSLEYFCAQKAAAPKWLDSRATTIDMPCSLAIRTPCAQQVSAIGCPIPFSPSYTRQEPISEMTRPSAVLLISPASNCST